MIPVPDWEEIAAKERAMRAVPDADILTLFRIAKLDPKRHFRGNDWRFVKFDGLDLQGFDMSGTRLYGATWVNAQVANTKLAGSDVEVTQFYKAKDWREADLTKDQRSVLELKVLLSGNPSPAQIEALANKHKIDERKWVRLIKSAETFADAHAYYRLMTDAGMGNSKFALTTLLDKAQAQAEVEAVRDYFKSLPVDIDSFVVATLISKSTSEEEARGIYNYHKDRVEKTQYVFNALIAKVDYYELASDIIDEMRTNGFYPDAKTLNPLIWKAKNFTGARWLYSLIPEPRTADMNAVLSHAKWQDFELGDRRALELLESGPQPEARTFNIIIGNCDMYSDGKSVLKLMLDMGFEPDIYSAYNLLKLIPVAEKLRVDRAFNLLTELIQQHGVVTIADEPSILSHLIRIINVRLSEINDILTKYDYGEISCRGALIGLGNRFARMRVAEVFAQAIGALPDLAEDP